MELADKVIVVTGGGNGIGRALCERFSAESPRGVVVADIEGDKAAEVASSIGGLCATTDVSSEQEIRALVELAQRELGPIDLFCSNAGIFVGGGVDAANEDWQRIFGVNFCAHLYGARAVLPSMLERGGGYLLMTVSAAGLLTQIESAPYTVTKHATLALGEWLRINHGHQGIRISCLCPQGVRTRMIMGEDMDREDDLVYASSLSPEEVAECTVRGLEAESSLILPHPEVAEYFRRKGSDYERWIRGMQRLRARVDQGYQL